MLKNLRVVGLLLIALLPSSAKILLLRAFGAKIGKGCYIGLTLIDARAIELGDYVRIGHLNIIHRLERLALASGAKIESLNWITGGGRGVLNLGRNASIRRLHFLEASGNISVGSNTVVAGRGTLFFTHGLAPDDLNVVKPIKIGDWCYVGAACRFLPGSGVPDYCFVGMGSVVVKNHKQCYQLLAGVPAGPVKGLAPGAPYFARPFLRHTHHPENWRG